MTRGVRRRGVGGIPCAGLPTSNEQDTSPGTTCQDDRPERPTGCHCVKEETRCPLPPISLSPRRLRVAGRLASRDRRFSPRRGFPGIACPRRANRPNDGASTGKPRRRWTSESLRGKRDGLARGWRFIPAIGWPFGPSAACAEAVDVRVCPFRPRPPGASGRRPGPSRASRSRYRSAPVPLLRPPP